MKTFAIFLYAVLLVVCSYGKEVTYTGSTPAAAVVRKFLDIPLEDSVDFIRWKINISGQHYTLQCSYGLGQPNTNGFINGGSKITVNGSLQKEHNFFLLSNGHKKLKLAVLNENLLHILNPDDSFLIGNGGWSYTLNNIQPEQSKHINFIQEGTTIKDSMVFEGRTPCGVPGIIEPGALCYKLKWYIVLYGNTKKNTATTYKVFGTAWREKGGRKGKWQLINTNDGRTIYRLNDETGNGLLYLLGVQENILLFTDAEGKILTGNEDFSFTLNRIL